MSRTAAQRGTRDVSDAQTYKLTREEVAAISEQLGKCINPATGEPVSARKADTAVLPVKGSRRDSEDGNGTGTCPECGAHVRLSTKGFVTSHSVRRTPLAVPPPSVRLAERNAEVTDTGARVGSPDAAMRTRAHELGAAAGTATVKIKMQVEGPDGKKHSEECEVPGTPDNIRTALRQEQKRKHPDAALLAKLGSMLRGATGTQAVPVIGAEPGTYKVREAVTLDAPNAPEGREERARADGSRGHVPTSPGPALVNGAAMSSEPPSDSARVNKKGGVRNAIGWGGPLGRPAPDRVAIRGDAEACEGKGEDGKGCTVVGCVAIVGGRYGYLECHVFRALAKRPRRRYWEHVATAERRAEEAKAAAARPKVTTHRQWPVTRQTMGGAAIRQV